MLYRGKKRGGGLDDRKKWPEFMRGKSENNNFHNSSLENMSLSELIVAEAIGIW